MVPPVAKMMDKMPVVLVASVNNSSSSLRPTMARQLVLRMKKKRKRVRLVRGRISPRR